MIFIFLLQYTLMGYIISLEEKIPVWGLCKK